MILFLQPFLIGTAAIDCGQADGPDIALLTQAAREFPQVPLVCEGRVHTP